MILSPNPNRKIFKLPKIPMATRTSCKYSPIANKSAICLTPQKFSSIRFNDSRHTIHNLNQKYSLIVKEKSEVATRIQELQNRIKRIKDLQLNYQVKFTSKEIHYSSIEELEKKAQSVFDNRRKVKSCKKIIFWWKRRKILSKIREQEQLTLDAVITVQRYWRKILKERKIQEQIKIAKALMNSSAILIQKHFRGYIARKFYKFQTNKNKMLTHFNYFDNLKQQLKIDSAQTILRAWRTYQGKKRLRMHRNMVVTTKKTILTILITEDSSTASEKIKTIIDKKNTIIHVPKPTNEPETPAVPFNRLRSGTEDFFLKVGSKNNYKGSL